MKIPDDVLRQYFELATDLPMNEIDEIMSGDIRDAHVRFARELINMYDSPEDFEAAQAKYKEIASGEIPEDIPTCKVEEDAMNICELLVKVGFASSKGDAKRMIAGNGVKINSEVQTDIRAEVELTEGKVVQFGKNRFVKIVK